MKKLLHIITLVAIAAILASCSSSRKIKSVFKSNTDSSIVVKIDSVVTKTTDSVTVKKDNTVTTTETEDNYTKETVIEFDTTLLDNWLTNLVPGLTKEYLDSMRHARDTLTTGWITADDYFPPDLNRVKKITIRETGTKKVKQQTEVNKYDSAHLKAKEELQLVKNTKVQVITTTVIKNKDKKTTSYWGWLWIGLITAAVFAVGWYFGWWRWLFALFKRKQKENAALAALSKEELNTELYRLLTLRNSVKPFTNEYNDLNDQIKNIQTSLHKK